MTFNEESLRKGIQFGLGSQGIWTHELEDKIFKEISNQALPQDDVSGSLRFSEREVDFAYLCGVFNTSGIDGLHNEIQRLKELGKEPHDIIEACRKQ